MDARIPFGHTGRIMGPNIRALQTLQLNFDVRQFDCHLQMRAIWEAPPGFHYSQLLDCIIFGSLVLIISPREREREREREKERERERERERES